MADAFHGQLATLAQKRVELLEVEAQFWKPGCQCETGVVDGSSARASAFPVRQSGTWSKTFATIESGGPKAAASTRTNFPGFN